MGVLSLDIGESLDWWSRRRREKLLGQIKWKCQHVVSLQPASGGVAVNSSLESPSGTLMWYCHQCGTWMTKGAADAHQQWLKNRLESDLKDAVDDILKRKKQLAKLHKKLSRLGGPV
ncbi:MAG: hypothetical protein F4015_06060 [Acidimicrobiia bacterium]|nr:hypothetical protein [Acidimicrobiia bacterium]